jgi:hypothetical protein
MEALRTRMRAISALRNAARERDAATAVAVSSEGKPEPQWEPEPEPEADSATPQDEQGQRELPPGWTEERDHETGEICYYHAETDRAVWEWEWEEPEPQWEPEPELEPEPEPRSELVPEPRPELEPQARGRSAKIGRSPAQSAGTRQAEENTSLLRAPSRTVRQTGQLCLRWLSGWRVCTESVESVESVHARAGGRHVMCGASRSWWRGSRGWTWIHSPPPEPSRT